jgi:P pilus assembly chaperone PapD
LLTEAQAMAGVMAESTRVIFPPDSREQSLQLVNLNTYPVVVEAWVDDGELDAAPEKSNAPIIPLPPIFRMNAGDQLSLRLLYTGAPLPKDRESLFWLNLYEIPPRPLDLPPDSATLTVAVRTQMKVFVRPQGLPMAAGEVADKLAFSLRAEPGRPALKIDNPTPYYASIAAVQYANAPAAEQVEALMVAPFGSLEVDIKAPARTEGDAEIAFTLIDDEGNALARTRAPTASPR